MPLAVSSQDAARIAETHFALQGQAQPLPGEREQNFLLTTPTGRYVLKIAPPEEPRAALAMQLAALDALRALPEVPQPIPASRGDYLVELEDGRTARLLRYLPGRPLAESRPLSPATLRALGALLARLDQALADFEHPAARREFLWDLRRADEVIALRLEYLRGETELTWALLRVLDRFHRRLNPCWNDLPAQVIHNDANDYNVLVDRGAVSGLLDFGDMLHAPRVVEVAVAAAYAMLDEADPLTVAAHLIAGYHAWQPLLPQEAALLYDLICTRLALSISLAAERAHTAPENAYLQVSAAPARRLLQQLVALDPQEVAAALTRWCPLPAASLPPVSLSAADILARRRRHLGPSLSLHYRQPLHIVRGFGQFLYDAEGRAYLDCVNNVCHVGHSHPRVVSAIAAQAAVLNTNTRYLHENLVRLAERLTARLPGDLSVWFFVNSGSEANDLALRLAWNYTRRRDVLVLEGAYHGNLSSLIAISPYKFDGPGGEGAPPWVHKIPMPCAYRGRYRDAPDPAAAYAGHVRRQIADLQSQGRGVAAFIAEAIMGTGGQVVFPPGTLRGIYQAVREAGGVCIADEVQIGFGRVGRAFWGFETQGVVPDIVTMGKPMGNGHPLAAVVTTPAIAQAFATGMEYFNTYGGNPVSCAAGLAVLDVIEEEGLQAHAQAVGEHWKAALRELMAAHPLIGDVRGEGLFLGVELVRDRRTLAPAAEEAAWLVEQAKAHGVLLGVDGPLHNVLKIKPPLVFTAADADRVVETLDTLLRHLAQVGAGV